MMSRFALVLFVAALIASGCHQQSEYDEIVERELSTGIAYDTLFLGYKLGMPAKAFYDHSWALNRKGLVMQGPQNQTVQYELKNELSYPATMYYYPDFSNGEVFQMRVRYQYDGWAPWTRHLMADSLQKEVVKHLERRYGEGFLKIGGKKGLRRSGNEYVKVDGNRRIAVSEISDSEVIAVFTDLIVEREMKRGEQ